MLYPGKDAPIVLMIPGSGPTDRDGNNTRGLKAATMKLLAEGLAARRVATVRIDKRGMYASAGAIPDANAVTIGDYATDVRSWIASIRRMTGTKCVWVLGHSEGGLVALSAAQKNTEICGLVLVAVPGRPTDQVLEEQLKSNPANAPILDQALTAISNLKAGQHVDASRLDPSLLRLFHPAIQNFLISEFSIDPAKLIGTLDKPVLIVQGERDVQVGVEDAQTLKGADLRAKLVLLPNTNHVLKYVSFIDRRANLSTYSDPSLPLAPGVVPAIADFILSSPQ
ncbi:alpha/beta fold hydrolase [Acetobacter musti]|uniref:Alpha/beta fold hydrolase n=2 Tax=Acetobacter musti TaxID=864732 RepID=A0ABX0JZK9_9PROT|nr:alpha/beta fold hydrolase [Acetobacter musti]